METPTLLLLTTDDAISISLANAIREAGYTLVPGRVYEMGIDSLARANPQVVLVQVGHHAADSIAFQAAAQNAGARVLLFSVPTTDVGYRALVTMLSTRSPYPIVEYDGDPTPLLRLLAPGGSPHVPSPATPVQQQRELES